MLRATLLGSSLSTRTNVVSVMRKAEFCPSIVVGRVVRGLTVALHLLVHEARVPPFIVWNGGILALFQPDVFSPTFS